MKEYTVKTESSVGALLKLLFRVLRPVKIISVILRPANKVDRAKAKDLRGKPHDNWQEERWLFAGNPLDKKTHGYSGEKPSN